MSMQVNQERLDRYLEGFKNADNLLGQKISNVITKDDGEVD